MQFHARFPRLCQSKLKQNGYHSAILGFISAKFVMCCPCVTPDTLFNINAIDIMQGLRDVEQNENNMAVYPCVRHYICLYSWSSYFALFFELPVY